MKSLILFIVLSFTLKNANASYPELFGASYSTTGIGNQANFDANDPSNNYYAPALLAFTDKFNVLAQASSTATHFKSIDNIVVTNSTNSSGTTTTGKANLSYPKFYGMALHASVPLGGNRHLGSLGLSVFLPIGDLVLTNSGDPYLPEYVMYKSRHQRTSAYINFAKKWSDDLAFSAGVLLGFQATAEVRTNLSLNGANYGSWARAQSKVSPSIGAIVSMVKTFDEAAISLSYQQEMKSNLKATVYGEITNPSLALLDTNMTTMIFYDPHTFRVGGTLKFEDLELFTGVEYLMWSGYKTPLVNVAKNGGVVVPSSNYETVVTRDTINPRIGLKYNITDRWSTLLGAQYRMTPFEGNFSGSGNSIDTNSLIASTGLQYRMVIWSKDVQIGTAFQYHHLEDKKVVKTTGQENGTAGSKIGAPGYTIGGYILGASVGVKFNF
jgi:long-subunit fatty acid transport protein